MASRSDASPDPHGDAAAGPAGEAVPAAHREATPDDHGGPALDPCGGASDRLPVSEHQRDVADLLAAIAHGPTGPGIETVTLAAAQGRTLASDVRSPVNVPPVDNSQMDGFAYRISDLPSSADANRAHLPLGPLVAAGDPPTELAPGTARPIMTGAAIPFGADAVLPVEESDRGRFEQVRPEEAAAEESLEFDLASAARTVGRFVRRAGSDTERGDVIARAGQILTPRLIGHLASVGMSEVEVREPLVALVLSTGSELRSASGHASPEGGADPEPGAQAEGPGAGSAGIYDANGPSLTAALTEMGVHVARTLRVADDPDDLLDQVGAALADTGAHLVVSSGGVSAGAVEPIRQVAELDGAPLRLAFQKVAMQPGGPQGLGVWDSPEGEVAWIALPGNPVSCLVSLEMFVREAVGASPRPRVRMAVRTQTGKVESSPAGMLQVRRARLQSDSTARLVGGPSSHLLGALALSDALVLVPPDVTRVEDRDVLDVLLLH